MLELAVVIFIFIFAVVVQVILIPFCLMVVLGLFGIHVGLWSCVAVVIVLRALMAILGGK